MRREGFEVVHPPDEGLPIGRNDDVEVVWHEACGGNPDIAPLLLADQDIPHRAGRGPVAERGFAYQRVHNNVEDGVAILIRLTREANRSRVVHDARA